MKLVTAEDGIRNFIQYVSAHKRQLDNWQYLHVVVQDPEKKVKIDEVMQFLEFHVNSPDSMMMVAYERNELIVFLKKDPGLTLTKFEKALQEDFPASVLRIQFRGFDGDGMERFASIVAPSLEAKDTISHVLFKRMLRSGNSILVLDDDPIVLKQIEKILFGIGKVVTLESPDNFLESYVKYAPDILFLDIHLKNAKGNELLKVLTSEIDPYAHVIMISSDTQKEMIVDIKDGGAKGFVVKPLERAKLYQKIVNAPTIITKASA